MSLDQGHIVSKSILSGRLPSIRLCNFLESNGEDGFSYDLSANGISIPYEERKAIERRAVNPIASLRDKSTYYKFSLARRESGAKVSATISPDAGLNYYCGSKGFTVTTLRCSSRDADERERLIRDLVIVASLNKICIDMTMVYRGATRTMSMLARSLAGSVLLPGGRAVLWVPGLTITWPEEVPIFEAEEKFNSFRLGNLAGPNSPYGYEHTGLTTPIGSEKIRLLFGLSQMSEAGISPVRSVAQAQATLPDTEYLLTVCPTYYTHYHAQTYRKLGAPLLTVRNPNTNNTIYINVIRLR